MRRREDTDSLRQLRCSSLQEFDLGGKYAFSVFDDMNNICTLQQGW